jgi:hypothetical protein
MQRRSEDVKEKSKMRTMGKDIELLFIYDLRFIFTQLIFLSFSFLSQSLSDPTEKPKGRRKHDRFNGMSEEELSQRQLPDHLTYNLDIVIVSLCKN